MNTALNHAQLSAPRQPVASPLPSDTQLRFVPGHSSTRSGYEAFIAAVFQRRYGAVLSHFLPSFLAVERAGQLRAALGVARADEQGSLFLEQYLVAPAEVLLGKAVGRPVARDSLIEVGNLASCGGGASQLLFLMLTAYINRIGAEWAIFTATPEVRKLLSRLGLLQYVLGEARGERLGDALADWGSYYDSRPQVVAVNALDAQCRLLREPRFSAAMLSCATTDWEVAQ